jgi:hypothetical protein
VQDLQVSCGRVVILMTMTVDDEAVIQSTYVVNNS